MLATSVFGINLADMPELPDINAYIEAIERRTIGQTLERITLRSAFLLRSAIPPIDDVANKRVVELRRLGKRIAMGFSEDYWLVIHLMIAGRFQWSDADAAPKKPTRNTLAIFHFSSGRLSITEAGTKKRASMHVVHGIDALNEHDPGGLEVLMCDHVAFSQRLRRENRTLKRALTDPRILSGIGNAYSDEILHAAQLSPVTLTSRLSDDDLRTLFDATRNTLRYWTNKFSVEAKKTFPKKVTAFRPEMAVHGRYGLPCPVCEKPVQRIRYASNEDELLPNLSNQRKIVGRSRAVAIAQEGLAEDH